MSNQRFITLAFLVGAVVVGLTMHSAVSELLAIMAWPDIELLNLVSISLASALFSGVVAFLALLRTPRSVAFVDEVVVELRKIFWPSREETINSTTVVLVASFTLAAALAFFDFFWAKVTGAFLFS